jgi:hypothetical protein
MEYEHCRQRCTAVDSTRAAQRCDGGLGSARTDPRLSTVAGNTLWPDRSGDWCRRDTAGAAAFFRLLVQHGDFRPGADRHMAGRAAAGAGPSQESRKKFISTSLVRRTRRKRRPIIRGVVQFVVDPSARRNSDQFARHQLPQSPPAADVDRSRCRLRRHRYEPLVCDAGVLLRFAFRSTDA